MKIGIVFDMKEDYNIENKDEYFDFCFFSEAEAAYKSLLENGHDVCYIGNPKKLLHLIIKQKMDYDLIYNIAEGYKSRNREGIVPAICEAFGIPYTGTDAFGLSLSLHKFQTICFLEKHNILVPKSILYSPTVDKVENIVRSLTKMNFPLILKPNHEGSSMGIKLVNNVEELTYEIQKLSKLFEQEILIQEFISGTEMSTCVLRSGEDAYAYSSVEYVTTSGNEIDIFTTEIKNDENYKMIYPKLTENELELIEKQAIFIHNLMGIRDISRVDWKFDRVKRELYFLEITPIPDLSEGSEFHWSAETKGQPYSFVFSEIVNSAHKRYPEI